MAASGSLSSLPEEELTLTVKWSGKEYTVRVCGDDSVAELKRRICELTNVLPKRQKLLYPKIGPKLSDDSIILSQLPLKSSIKMTMIGTVEDEIIVDQVDDPEIADDFELGQDEAIDIKDKEVNIQKLRRRISQYKLYIWRIITHRRCYHRSNSEGSERETLQFFNLRSFWKALGCYCTEETLLKMSLVWESPGRVCAYYLGTARHSTRRILE